MVSSVQGSSDYDVSALQQKMRSFLQGKSSISKDDLTQIDNDMKSKGLRGSKALDNLVSNYDSIDTDNNGMSFDELQSYCSSQKSGQSQTAGFSLGFPPPGIMSQDQPKPKNLTKDDIAAVENDMKSNGVDTTGIQNIIDNYDKIDTDGNGISPDEMQAYLQSQQTVQNTTQGTQVSDSGSSTDGSSVNSVPHHHHHHHHMMNQAGSSTDNNSSNSNSDSNSSASSDDSTGLTSYMDKLLKNYLSYESNSNLDASTTYAVA